MRGFAFPSRHLSIGALMCVMSLAAARDIAFAQNPLGPAVTPATEATKKDAASGKTPAEPSLPAASVRYLLDKNGIPVAVPWGATLEEYLNYVDSKNKPVAGPNLAPVSEIEIDGTVDEDRANLKIAYTIRLQESDRYISVPLFLNEAVLKQAVYHGDGVEPSSERKDSEMGHVWWFRGRGPHRLELSVIVPLKKSRRLVLSLPSSPFSKAKILVPHASINTKVVREQTYVETKSTPDGKTMIEAIELGTRFEISWNPTVDIRPNEVLLESQTAIRAQIEPDSIQIRADQQIKSLQGAFGQVVVRLPTGSESIRLDDSDRQTFVIDSRERNLVTVTLKEKATSVQLGWTLRLPNRILAPQTLDGFVVEGKGARKQDGRIGLSMSEGLRFLSEPRDNSVIRINAGEFPSSLGPVNRAYQFLAQPFKLPMTVEDVKPYFQVNPQLHLIASAQQLILDGKFDFLVERESLNEVTLAWPGLKSEGWTIDAVEARTIDAPGKSGRLEAGLVDDRGQPASGFSTTQRNGGIVESFSVDDKGQISVKLAVHQSGEFALHVRARRQMKAGDDILLTLPRPRSASRMAPSILVLANFENVETDLTARGETFMRLLPSSSLDSLDVPQSLNGLKSSVYRIDTDEQSLGLRVMPQKRRTRTDTLVDVQWQDNQFGFVQHLKYDVAYERLSQIRVAIPTQLEAERIRFFTTDDLELTPEPIPATAGSPRQVLLKLPDPQLGRFEIRAKYSIPFVRESAFATDSTVTFPIMGSADEPFTETQVSLIQSDWFDAEPQSPETWRARSNRLETWEWTADGSPGSLPIKLARSTHTKGTGTVSRAFIAAYVGENGTGNIRAVFRMTNRSNSLSVVLPATATPAIFYWDDRKIADQRCIETRPESRQYTIDLSDEPDNSRTAEHSLRIEYGDQFGSPFGWLSRLELQAPQLPRCLWYSQVVWQTVLPSGHYLFTYPKAGSPMFRWQRSGLLWSRKSDTSVEQLQQSINTGAAPSSSISDLVTPAGPANSYSFSQFGSPRTLVFQTLSSPMVLFLGAGFSLVVGFIMLRMVVLRHVMTVLVLGLLMAIVGLWYSAPLELLIQPMIAGMIFPLTAVLLDNWIRRRNESASIPFDNQGEFPPMHAFGSHFVVRQTDPNEATVHRPATRDSQASVSVEAGSGVS